MIKVKVNFEDGLEVSQEDITEFLTEKEHENKELPAFMTEPSTLKYLAAQVGYFLQEHVKLVEPLERGRIQITITTNRAQDGFHLDMAQLPLDDNDNGDGTFKPSPIIGCN